MSPAGASPDRRYVAAIEAAWSRLTGRPVVVSRRDYEIVAGWHARGIPLSIVLEAFEHRARFHRSRSAPRSLAAMARAVEEGWSAVSQGRAAAPGASARAAGAEPGEPWAGGAWESHPPLAGLVSGLRERARGGEDASSIDAELDRDLAAAAPPGLVRAAEDEATAGLAPFRPRLSPRVYRDTLERARVDRLRQALGLPRLALRPSSDPRSPAPEE